MRYRITYRPGQEKPDVQHDIDGRGFRPPNPGRQGWERSLVEILDTISDTLYYEQSGDARYGAKFQPQRGKPPRKP